MSPAPTTVPEIIPTKTNVSLDYVAKAPLALAFERLMECRILSEQRFERPMLDIGCGEGLFARILFAEPIDTGIDPNPRELSRARELKAYSELIECYGDTIPKPDGSYRTILSNSVVEHIPDLKPVLVEAMRLLEPGGRLYLTVPSHLFDKHTWTSQFLQLLGLKRLQGKFTVLFNRFWAHYHFYTPKRWQEIVSEVGFEVVEAREYGPKRACLMNDFLVPFSALELVTKKILNRWTLFPPLRKVFLAPATFLGSLVLRGADRCENGGLLFLSLRKAA